METKNLKNYGRALSELFSSMPRDLEREIWRIGARVVIKNMGILNLIRFGFLFPREKRRMLKQDISSIREKGLNDEKFIKSEVEHAALFSAISKISGKDKALHIFYEMNELAAKKLWSRLLPTPEDFKRFDDPFNAFKDYFMAMVSADTKAGCHLGEIIQNTQDAYQWNCIYCVWYELYKILGVEEGCQFNCYADDVFFPDYCQSIGIRYGRTNTIARGGICCDFRFERSLIRDSISHS